MNSNSKDDYVSVFIPDEVIEDCLNEWRYSLIGKLDLVKLKMETVEASLRKQWIVKGKIKLIPLGKGFFIIKLDNEEDRSLICIEYWKENIILQMGNKVGRAIKVDETALKRESGFYASVLVEVDMEKSITSKISIESKYGKFEKYIQIPKLPKFCNHCTVIGYLVAEYKMKRKEQQHEPAKEVQPRKVWKHKVEEIFREEESIDAIIHPILQIGESSPSGSFHILQDKSKELTELLEAQNSTLLVQQILDVIHNSTATNKGNICLLWSASIKDPVVVSITKQAITVDIGGQLVTGVHADSLTLNRRSLWEDLTVISSLNKPWIIIGDFNAVFSMEEKKGGRKPLTTAMLDFNNCIQNCEIIQAPKTGLEFSWCNNRAGKKRIVCNLDKAFYNMQCLEAYPSWGYKVGTIGIFDHSPMFGANVTLPKPSNVPFRALKVWMTREGFKKVIEESWKIEVRGNLGFIFLTKLKHLKVTIKNWNWNVFGDVKKKLKQADMEVMRLSLISD
ncbi:uncharacterized protein LOC113306280 [Papaver somniferum]|uniref:uncharacterized protein LOC113306280 n=1 Tax=Papaver somniferum TaxID=3469 RepID=UPI000E6F979D|nr:uncharacterized protein LOC113306280 [Papaver somniferum]